MRAALLLLIGLTASCVVGEEIADTEVEATEAGKPHMGKAPVHKHNPGAKHHKHWVPNGNRGWKPPFIPECRTNAGCDDGNSCTKNFCIEGACVEEPSREILLSGTADPTTVGWTLYGEEAASTSGQWLTVDTASLEAPKPISMYAFDLPPALFQTHDLSWRMVVHEGSHNAFDASTAFFPAYSGWYGYGAERGQMMFFEPGAIGWGDESEIVAMNAGVEHEYRLHIANGHAELYVDGELALWREEVELNGTIAFGDQTNDTGVDGAFSIREVALVANEGCSAP